MAQVRHSRVNVHVKGGDVDVKEVMVDGKCGVSHRSLYHESACGGAGVQQIELRCLDLVDGRVEHHLAPQQCQPHRAHLDTSIALARRPRCDSSVAHLAFHASKWSDPVSNAPARSKGCRTR
eukprot:1184762-Prorocentrum_minimum.AAC.2